MQDDQFISSLERFLNEERKVVLASELKTDFEILKRQRQGESVPPKQYWALKTFPRPFQISYIDCLCHNRSRECYQIKDLVFSRALETATLVLMEWAERPSTEISVEQVEKWMASAIEFDSKTGYYAKQFKQLCNKAVVKRAFRDAFYKTTGRRMRATGESSIFRDEQSIQISDARIVVEWDCGGWSHFREEIWVEWKNQRVTVPQSIVRGSATSP